MISRERIIELWQKVLSTKEKDKGEFSIPEIFANLIIAEHDAELRKQEPYGYLRYDAGHVLDFHFKKHSHTEMKPVYESPMPPHEQQVITGDMKIEIVEIDGVKREVRPYEVPSINKALVARVIELEEKLKQRGS